jgi:hypothetical protein
MGRHLKPTRESRIQNGFARLTLGRASDACDEIANDETVRLAAMIDDVVAGRFREGIAMPPVGEGWLEWARWSHERRSSGRLQIDHERARAMLAVIEGSPLEWAPWPQRKATVQGA